MAEIFLNYRSVDNAYAAAAISASLVEHFGREHVFRDCDSMSPGTVTSAFAAVRRSSMAEVQLRSLSADGTLTTLVTADLELVTRRAIAEYTRSYERE